MKRKDVLDILNRVLDSFEDSDRVMDSYTLINVDTGNKWKIRGKTLDLYRNTLETIVQIIEYEGDLTNEELADALTDIILAKTFDPESFAR